MADIGLDSGTLSYTGVPILDETWRSKVVNNTKSDWLVLSNYDGSVLCSGANSFPGGWNSNESGTAGYFRIFSRDFLSYSPNGRSEPIAPINILYTRDNVRNRVGSSGAVSEDGSVVIIGAPTEATNLLNFSSNRDVYIMRRVGNGYVETRNIDYGANRTGYESKNLAASRDCSHFIQAGYRDCNVYSATSSGNDIWSTLTSTAEFDQGSASSPIRSALMDFKGLTCCVITAGLIYFIRRNGTTWNGTDYTQIPLPTPLSVTGGNIQLDGGATFSSDGKELYVLTRVGNNTVIAIYRSDDDWNTFTTGSLDLGELVASSYPTTFPDSPREPSRTRILPRQTLVTRDDDVLILGNGDSINFYYYENKTLLNGFTSKKVTSRFNGGLFTGQFALTMKDRFLLTQNNNIQYTFSVGKEAF